jgi:hypothetical protein
MDLENRCLASINSWERHLIRSLAHPLARWAFALCVAVSFSVSACKATEKEEQVGVGLTGLDHLAEHLSIQEFTVNGTSGHKAGRGGSTVCCVNVPAKWRPGITLKVRWGVTNWKRRAFTFYEREVELEKYDELGPLYIHFLPNGDVRAVSSMFAAWGQGGFYPGPAYDTVLRKQPWKDFKRKPDEPEFAPIQNAMEDK